MRTSYRGMMIETRRARGGYQYCVVRNHRVIANYKGKPFPTEGLAISKGREWLDILVV